MLTLILGMNAKKPVSIPTEFTVDKLVEYAARLIPLFVPKQGRYKVRDYPDVRTVRFYTTRGLMDKPDRYNGQQAAYSFKHLLQLIAIKYLQFQYLPIKKISEMINGLSQEELLKLINHPAAKNSESAFAREILLNEQFGLSQRTHESEKSKIMDGEKVWKHYVLEPGVEINIREDFLPKSPSHIEVLANRVRIILKQIKSRRGD